MSFSDTRLRVFYAVAKHLSFTRAAEELYLTQPAVTFQIRQLEEHFDTRLFDRHHNRISLTEAGLEVYSYAERILDLYRETEKAVSELTGVTRGVVKVGASTTIGEYLLPRILSDYRDQFNDVQIRLSIDNTRTVVRKLEDATIDVGMIEGPVKNKNIARDGCLDDELVVILPPNHPLCDLDEIPVKELKAYPFVSREEGSGTRQVVHDHLLHAGLPYDQLDIVLELGSTEAVKGSVEGGIGIGIVSSASLIKELKLGILVAKRVQGMRITRTINFIHQKQKFRSKAVEAFINFAKDHCKHMVSPIDE
ncbi:transcriptional regulator, LysR family [Magnetococcus marinus MC-1]|uniref:Transcriptional regulator, LysR family n=1 Tax=Magnetococcus marinus (strain ATCC BAA-1437 / JCM 17883 / MC-1) TaxID=156889 RepID=A0L4T1_MAGMM|nr:selenium metabolism-associated LysR family transcriptional regulator [Magnetococcus marinus]ABK42974.1 transcriptional regulator, LysR family [Magnetococcus marinus MC-1]